MPPAFTLAPAAAMAPATLHAAFTTAFADYLLGPFSMPPEQWPAFLARQCVDLGASRVALHDGAITAFALTAPRPDLPSWRLGTMGALPAARGSGAAQALLDDFIARAREAGQGQVELECFAQNERGLRLYRSRGFEVVDGLYGYTGHVTPLACDQVQEVTLQEACEAISAHSSDLPLQATPASLCALTMPLRAWRRGAAVLVASTAPDKLVLHSLVDRTPGQADAARLVQHAASLHPGHLVTAPQLLRDAVGGQALQQLGLTRLPLHQWWMRRPLG